LAEDGCIRFHLQQEDHQGKDYEEEEIMARLFPKLISASLLVALASASLVSSPAGAVELSLPKSGNKTFAIGPCESAAQMDCIQSLSANIDGQVVQGVFEGFSPNHQIEEPFGNAVDRRSGLWAFIHNGQTYRESLRLSLSQVGTVLGITPDKKKITGSELMGELWNRTDSALPSDARLSLTVRTSWLKAENVTMNARESNFVERKHPKGRIWTIEGKRTEIASYNGDFEKKLQSGSNADISMPIWLFHIHNAGGSLTSFFGSPCAKYGYTVQSNNAPGGGTPQWNPDRQSLDFNIQAPHRLVDGALNRGFFYLKVNRDYMKCAWPTSGLHKANQFSVQILNEDGTKQVATTVVSYRAGVLRVAAENFHYSSPTIRIKAKK
jgi:hypothetical protein